MTDRIATAEWARPALFERKYVYREGSVWLGRSPNGVPIGYGDDRHVCLVSGSRGGKGTSSIINNLCLWPGSLVVIDPKGENATVTVPRRGQGAPYCEGMDQVVHVLDPFETAQIDESYRSHFNPLDALDPDSEGVIDDAILLADAIVIIHEKSDDPYWDEEARSLIKGLLLHVLTDPAFEERRNLVTLRELIARGNRQAVEELRRDGEQHIPTAHALLWTQMALNPALDGLIAGIGDTFFNLQADAPKQYYGVLAVANRNTEFIESPGMQRCLATSDFDLSSLKTDPKGMSLYLCLPQRHMNTHHGWLRMMLALTVQQMEIVEGQPASGYPVLMLLDEFAGLKRMETIENAVAQLAGFGVKMFFVLQSLEQLKAVYKDKWETFLTNCGVRMFFNVEDHFSREYFSKLIGDTELRLDVRSQSDAFTKSHTEADGTSETRSKTKGSGHSEAIGESHGTTESAGWSTSHTKGGSSGTSFSTGPGGSSFGTNSSGSSSDSHGTSGSRGTSHNNSRTVTDNTSSSDTAGTGTNRTRTDGTTEANTTGTSETIHRRPLISPDEIGKLCARIDDDQAASYPGLAIALVSGQPPMVVRRTNYYEDLQCIGLFAPHPSHPFSAPILQAMNPEEFEKYVSFLNGELSWKLTTQFGTLIAAGYIIGIAYRKTKPIANVIAPVSGRVVKKASRRKSTLPYPSCQIMTYDLPTYNQIDPFREIALYCKQFADARERENQKFREDVKQIHSQREQQLAWKKGGEDYAREAYRANVARKRKWKWLSIASGALAASGLAIRLPTGSGYGTLLATLGLLALCASITKLGLAWWDTWGQSEIKNTAPLSEAELVELLISPKVKLSPELGILKSLPENPAAGLPDIPTPARSKLAEAFEAQLNPEFEALKTSLTSKQKPKA